VVTRGCLLHPELMVDVFDAACAHSLRVEDVDLDEVGGCRLLNSGPVPSSLCSARIHQKVHPSSDCVIPSVILLIQHIKTIVVMTGLEWTCWRVALRRGTWVSQWMTS